MFQHAVPFVAVLGLVPCSAGAQQSLNSAPAASVDTGYSPTAQEIVKQLAGKTCRYVLSGYTPSRDVFYIKPDGKLWTDRYVGSPGYETHRGPFPVEDAGPALQRLGKILIFGGFWKISRADDGEVQIDGYHWSSKLHCEPTS
jgi:hypothetical protein